MAHTANMAGPPRGLAIIAAAWVVAHGCDADSATSAEAEEAESESAEASAKATWSEPPSAARPDLGSDARPRSDARPKAEPGGRDDDEVRDREPPPAATPIGYRQTQRPLMVYVEPRLGSEFRGKIRVGEIFEFYERVPGEGCRGEGWGRIGEAAFVCLHQTEATDEEATVLPGRLVDGLAPFFYARLKPKRGGDDNPPAPRWRSRRAMKEDAEPEGLLEPAHDYAFVGRRRFRGGAVLYTPRNRVVREGDLQRMKPSDFAGRNVRARPIPSATVMAWSISWPYALVRAEPRPDAEELGRAKLHAELYVHDEPQVHRGETWYPVADPVAGWVLADEVRRWVPMAAPSDVREDETWLDIDLREQVLGVYRGESLEFVTLISSGNYKHGTPAGLFRVESKWAWADMRSRAGDDESYFVEGVPWVQYFRGRYALHGTFWHNRFGRRTSHGCINLSAHDARWVYERTSPVAKPGWIVINEHVKELGTLVRIRKGDEVPPDRRRAVRGG